MGRNGYLSKPLDPEISVKFDAPVAPEAKSTIDSIFDREQLETLGKHLPVEQVDEFVIMFLEHVGEQLSEMHAHAGSSDLAGLGKDAHSLISIAGSAAKRHRPRTRSGMPERRSEAGPFAL